MTLFIKSKTDRMIPTPASNTRVRVLIEGRVQGVFFRAYARDQAVQLKISGWVRNLPDGRVEAVAEGLTGQVEAFIGWCHKGPDSAQVMHVTVEKQDYCGEFQTFTVRHS